MAPMIGMMRSATSELTMAPNAAPMMTPTARSMTLPRSANFLNSSNIAPPPQPQRVLTHADARPARKAPQSLEASGATARERPGLNLMELICAALGPRFRGDERLIVRRTLSLRSSPRKRGPRGAGSSPSNGALVPNRQRAAGAGVGGADEALGRRHDRRHRGERRPD